MIERAIADCPIAIPTEVRHIAPGGVMVHYRGTFQVGGKIKLWCVCGFKWHIDLEDYQEANRQASEAWQMHLMEVEP